MSAISTDKVFNNIRLGQSVAYTLQKVLGLEKYPDFEIAECGDGNKHIFFKAKTENLPDKLAEINLRYFHKSDYGFHPVIESEGAEHTMVGLPIELLGEASRAFARNEIIENNIHLGQSVAFNLQKVLGLEKYPDIEIAECGDGKKHIFFKAETDNLQDKLAEINLKYFHKSDHGFHPVIESEGAEHTLIGLPIELLGEASRAFARNEIVENKSNTKEPPAETSRPLAPEAPSLAEVSFSEQFRESAQRLNRIISQLGVFIADTCLEWWKPDNTIEIEGQEFKAFNKQQKNRFCSPLLDITAEELEFKISPVNNLLLSKGIQLSVGTDSTKEQNACYLIVDSDNLSPKQISTYFDEIMDSFNESMRITDRQRYEALSVEPAKEETGIIRLAKSITQKISDLLRAA